MCFREKELCLLLAHNCQRCNT